MDHPNAPLVYICYSKADQDRVEELLTHLQPALDGGLFDYWSHEKIHAGRIRQDEIEAAIASAKVAVLLVSSEFLADTSVTEIELTLLLDAFRRGDLTLLWLPESASSYEMTALKDIEPIHPADQPLDTLNRAERQEALVEIARKILSALKEGRSPANGQDLQPEARREKPASGGSKLNARTVKYSKIAISLLGGAMLAYLISQRGQWWVPTPPENQVITVSVKERPLQEVFKEVARQIGAVPVVDPRLTGTLSVSMKNAKVKDFMNEICYEAGKCTWQIQPGDPPALMVLPPGAVPLPDGGK